MSDPVTTVPPQTRKKTHPGKCPRITPDLLDRIAERLEKGLPLNMALDLEDEPVPVEHWNKHMQQSPRMARLFNQRLARLMERGLEEIGACTLKTMPAKVWIYERRFPQYFSTSRQVKHEHSGTLLLGVTEGIRERASAAGRNRIQEPTGPRQAKQKRLAAQVIDVEVTPKT